MSFWQRPAEPTGRLASCPSAGLGALNTSGALRRIHPFTYAIRPVGSAGLEVDRTGLDAFKVILLPIFEQFLLLI